MTKKTNVPSKMTRQEFVAFLDSWSYGAQPVTIVAETPQARYMNKHGKSKYPMLVKRAEVNGILGYNYQNSVNKQRAREGKETDFLSLPLWNGNGKRINAVHATNLKTKKDYLTLKVERVVSSVYIDRKDMRIIDKNKLQGLFYERKSSSTRQGVEKEIKPREFLIDNILGIRWFGTFTEIVPDPNE